MLARLVLPAEEPVSSHVVEFYETEEFLVDTVSGFIRTRVRIPPSPCIDRLVASEAARPPDGSGKRSSERRRLAGF